MSTNHGFSNTAFVITETVPLKSNNLLHAVEYGNGGQTSTTGSDDEECGNNSKHVASIRMFGSISLLVNELVGPGMLDFPATFQRNGFIPTALVIIVIAALSAKISLNLANVISMLPGNSNFSKEVEYSQTFEHFLGSRASVLTQLIFFGSMMCLMIASIVETSQIVDAFFGNEVQSIGIQFSPMIKIVTWDNNGCDLEENVDACVPFVDTGSSKILTLGYVLCALMFIPIGRLSLEGNMFWQEISFVLMLFCCAQFVYEFCTEGFDFPQNMPLWSENINWQNLIGVTLFNYAIVVAIPSWLYEKSPDVGVSEAITYSCSISSIMYIVVGAFGALSISDVPPNVLSVLSSGEMGSMANFCSSMFTFFSIGLGIPLFSVLMRLNLVGSGFCSETVGQHLTTTLPWGISWLLYQGKIVEHLMSWGGMLLSLIIIVAPLYLACRIAFSENNLQGSILDISGRWTKLTEKVELTVLCVVAAAVLILALLRQS
mmetsp:Transcript_8843/g.13019  ORF Transcript_8843/g.13019 Transcript_8843/m.13019 type:complete len:488 (-) Transcript_8843:375-1838(-)|eukprot:CAMPEP_0196823786 /NCGR_PEP_ID=MMETSP1362-20130617/88962_1 /TAXON_ID=163516 /ORGANISM="Leptocylindrus danicus, Strain CCMP1856" /LENGTH=487 /DNA_ID=CAMNT_0042203781 /DNA_START=268 /DNA_END=1734 /DNA_ORIENTATION=-